ncbi:OmpA family protein [Labilibaculum sp. DW002]|uniref:OmpA family protein n=1 Tax=Paralabilibaculum antarcticum TaxID=2912572 RepID=A0ABT5VS52_9BACT|nr:OmpA family protein [Labilibaculum sp. DW002]MDE5418252.1 OmpA family protein [Labilibaculum sp. DW002]
MKKLVFLSLLFTLSITILNAQIVDPEKVAKKQGTKRTNRKIEKGIDKGFDKLEEGLGRLFGKKKKKKKKQEAEAKKEAAENANQNSSNSKENIETRKPNKPNVVWNKFDFVPGDKVIFEDGPNIMEENGEFPSRWDLKEGNVEIAQVDGENVIYSIEHGSIVPYLKNSKEDYLPEVFTIEFDAFFSAGSSGRYFINFFDKKNQRNDSNKTLYIYVNSLTLGESSANYPGKNRGNRDDIGGWRHISVAFTKGKLKAYMDDTRLINIPHYESNPTGLTIEMEKYSSSDYEKYIKNIRIAKGGVKYYDRILQDGKIICNGIRFDTGKSTIKPESMGAINKIFQLMQKQTDLNFSIEGHTDSDGDDASNKRLSEARAKVVMEKLIQMGISSNRLSYAGFGESKPIDNNNTSEGKANNRRVEFVKTEGNTASSNSNSSSNSIFNSLDRNAIDTKMRSLENGNIQVANQSGVVLGNGTTIIYGTSDGNLGKMEVLNVDENDNYKLTVRYVTYNDDGSVHSKSNNLEIGGTYTCDLDEGNTENLMSSEEDFWLSRSGAKEAKIEQMENTGFYVVPN